LLFIIFYGRINYTTFYPTLSYFIIYIILHIKIKGEIILRTHFIGIDAGNSAVKLVASVGGGAEIAALIPNVSARAVELELPPITTNPLKQIHAEILAPMGNYKGEYFIGDLAAQQATEDLEQDRSRDKADSDNINLLTPISIAQFCQNGDKVALGIGVPFADFSEQKIKIEEKLKRRFLIRFGTYAGSRAGEIVDFEICAVDVYPQTAAGYLAQFKGRIGRENPDWINKNVVVVDLGLGQTGLAYLSKGNPIKSGCDSIDQPAFVQVARGVREFLNRSYKRDLTIPETLGYIEAGKYQIRNEIIDLENILNFEIERYVKAIKTRWSDLLAQTYQDQANVILLIGGGAATPRISEFFEQEFDLPVVVGDNPRFSNAYGYLERARKKYEREINENGTNRTR
jgi:hypothetical protein